jgi:hypothetical protein
MRIAAPVSGAFAAMLARPGWMTPLQSPVLIAT